MILIQQLKLQIPHTMEQIKNKAARALQLQPKEILDFQIIRRSLDARKKPELYYIYTLEVSVQGEKRVLERAQKNKRAKEQFSVSDRQKFCFPDGFNAPQCKPRVIIVGAGPAGLFCAYYLARAGLAPLLIERGKSVDERQRDVEQFWKTGVLDPSSNVQFGEGGAGTFSDGKLNTLVKDREGLSRAVLETFVRFGAKDRILYDAKPHIGTDVLARVVKAMREEIQTLGGTIRFESQMTGLKVKDGILQGIIVNDTEELPCDKLVLAIGHSARDTIQMLHQKGIPMEAKSFAVGFRVEHPQKLINASQYGCQVTLGNSGVLEELGAAAYKVTAKTEVGRGVYSFCMCPGGYVVNASSEEGRLAVNGMSYSGRDGLNANSAIIVSVSPEDYPGEGPLAGIRFQRMLEEKAYQLGEGKIPVQRYGEYYQRVMGIFPRGMEAFSGEELLPQTKGSYTWADLSGLLPDACSRALVQGMEQFGRQIPGFDCPNTILLGVESRTSSPVRILRNEELMSPVQGIYPCGEGAGYAGGITSAAMDGLRVAQQISCLTN